MKIIIQKENKNKNIRDKKKERKPQLEITLPAFITVHYANQCIITEKLKILFLGGRAGGSDIGCVCMGCQGWKLITRVSCVGYISLVSLAE